MEQECLRMLGEPLKIFLASPRRDPARDEDHEFGEDLLSTFMPCAIFYDDNYNKFAICDYEGYIEPATWGNLSLREEIRFLKKTYRYLRDVERVMKTTCFYVDIFQVIAQFITPPKKHVYNGTPSASADSTFLTLLIILINTHAQET